LLGAVSLSCSKAKNGGSLHLLLLLHVSSGLLYFIIIFSRMVSFLGQYWEKIVFPLANRRILDGQTSVLSLLGYPKNGLSHG
jgi:hypothetical protein